MFFPLETVKVRENCPVMVYETANGYFLPNVVPQNVVGAANHCLQDRRCEKSNKCEYCEFAFVQALDLRRHNKTHIQNWNCKYSFMVLLMQQTTALSVE